MSVPKIVVHTDVFLEHLCGTRHPSALRIAMEKFFCYATVFHAIELFSLATSEKEYAAMEDALSAMKVLGLNPKNAKKYGALLSSAKGVDRWNILIAGLCIESRLPLLTDEKKGFRNMRELLLVSTGLLTRQRPAEEVLREARKRAGTMMPE